jgi:hypothetical protein
MGFDPATSEFRYHWGGKSFVFYFINKTYLYIGYVLPVVPVLVPLFSLSQIYINKSQSSAATRSQVTTTVIDCHRPINRGAPRLPGRHDGDKTATGVVTSSSIACALSRHHLRSCCRFPLFAHHHISVYSCCPCFPLRLLPPFQSTAATHADIGSIYCCCLMRGSYWLHLRLLPSAAARSVHSCCPTWLLHQ